MEFYNDTPATKYFNGYSATLAGEWGSADEVSLFVNFAPDCLNFALGVYDRAARQYTYNISNVRVSVAMNTIAAIENQYKTTVPDNVKAQVKQFIAARSKAFYIDTNLEDEVNWEHAYCETCGDTNVAQVAGFYFPAIPDANVPASLGFIVGGFCSGDMKTAGEFNEVKSIVLREAHHQLKFAESIAETDIKDFIAQVEATKA